MRRESFVLFRRERKTPEQTRQKNLRLKVIPWVLASFMVMTPHRCNKPPQPKNLQPPPRTHILPTPITRIHPTLTPIPTEVQIDKDRGLEMWKEITTDFRSIRIFAGHGLFSPPLLEGTSPAEILQWMAEALAELHSQRLRGPDDEGTTEATTGILEKFLALGGKIVIVTQTPEGNKVTVIGQGGCVEAEVWFESSGEQKIERTDRTNITLFAIPPLEDPLYYGPLVKLDAEEIPGKPKIGEPIEEGQAIAEGAMWKAMDRALQLSQLSPFKCPKE